MRSFLRSTAKGTPARGRPTGDGQHQTEGNECFTGHFSLIIHHSRKSNEVAFLITPAHNEEAFIEKTLASMVAQTRLPERWMIVDDGSSDGTAEIVEVIPAGINGSNCPAPAAP